MSRPKGGEWRASLWYEVSVIYSVAETDNTITVRIGLPQPRLQTHGWLEEEEENHSQEPNSDHRSDHSFNTKGQWYAAWL